MDSPCLPSGSRRTGYHVECCEWVPPSRQQDICRQRHPNETTCSGSRGSPIPASSGRNCTVTITGEERRSCLHGSTLRLSCTPCHTTLREFKDGLTGIRGERRFTW